jgi:hypothetical protein
VSGNAELFLMARLLSFSASAPAEAVLACCPAGFALAGFTWHTMFGNTRVSLTAANEHNTANRHAGRNNFDWKLDTF